MEVEDSRARLIGRVSGPLDIGQSNCVAGQRVSALAPSSCRPPEPSGPGDWWGSVPEGGGRPNSVR